MALGWRGPRAKARRTLSPSKKLWQTLVENGNDEKQNAERRRVHRNAVLRRKAARTSAARAAWAAMTPANLARARAARAARRKNLAARKALAKPAAKKKRLQAGWRALRIGLKRHGLPLTEGYGMMPGYGRHRREWEPGYGWNKRQWPQPTYADWKLWNAIYEKDIERNPRLFEALTHAVLAEEESLATSNPKLAQMKIKELAAAEEYLHTFPVWRLVTARHVAAARWFMDRHKHTLVRANRHAEVLKRSQVRNTNKSIILPKSLLGSSSSSPTAGAVAAKPSGASKRKAIAPARRHLTTENI